MLLGRGRRMRPAGESSRHRRMLLVLAMLSLLGNAGCAGYQLGPRSLYRSDLRTVHVPVFTSGTLRRDVGEQLTEAVIKEIESRTPYKVSSSVTADSVLTGRIVNVAKRLLVENQNDEARALELDMVAQVNWVDRRGAAIIKEAVVPVAPLALTIGSNSAYVPEAGQSLATAQQEAIRQAAAEIVSHMEMPW